MANWDGAQNWDAGQLWDGTDSTFEVELDPADFPPGEYTFTVIATDGSPAANQTVGTPVTFTVPTTEGPAPEHDYPDYLIEVSIEPGEWYDITNKVHDPDGVTITRGRTVALDDVQPGECAFTIRDQEREFDPTNTVGPWFNMLFPGIPVRVSAIYPTGGTPELRFVGYIESWPQIHTVGAPFVDVPVVAYDELSVLARRGFQPARPFTLDSVEYAKLGNGNRMGGTRPTFSAQLSGARVRLLLDAAGYVRDNTYHAGAGNSYLCSSVADEPNMLEHLRKVSRTELASFYCDRAGVLQWEERRHASTDTRQSTARALFADSDGYALPYSGLELDPADTRQLRNSVTRGSAAIPEVTARSAASIAEMRGLVFEDVQTDLLFDDVTDAASQCRYLLARFRRPTPRVNRLDVKPRRNAAATFPFVVTAEIGDRVVVARTPSGDGDPFVQVCVIEQIIERFSTVNWESSYVLSQPDLTPVFRLNDTGTADRLNSSNVMAY